MRETIGDGRALGLISGYRNPKTNVALSGTADRSLHTVGRAINFRHPSRSPRQLAAIAREVGAGGVGIYSRSTFVHVASGARRNWGS